jgi:hypothetical protein
MRRLIIIGMIIYTLLGFSLASIPFTNLNISDGSMLVEYGLPLRWMTVHRGLPGDISRPGAVEWWRTDKRSFSLLSFMFDVGIAALAGLLLTMLSVRVWKCGPGRLEKGEKARGNGVRLEE